MPTMPAGLLRLLRRGCLYSRSLSISYMADGVPDFLWWFHSIGVFGGVKVVSRGINVGLEHLCTESK